MSELELNKKLVVAIQKGDFNAVKECIEQGADVNTFEIGDKLFNPLYGCIVMKQPKIFAYLVSKGANVTEKIGDKKHSLLYYACTQDNPNIFIIANILENGGVYDISYAPKGEMSPKDIAKATNNIFLTQSFERAISKTIKSNKR